MIDLAAFDEDTGYVNAIIDTPKGSRNKFKYDEKLGIFRLGGALPLGAVFPFDFGYIPSTKAGDGDPLDEALQQKAGLQQKVGVPVKEVMSDQF